MFLEALRNVRLAAEKKFCCRWKMEQKFLVSLLLLGPIGSISSHKLPYYVSVKRAKLVFQPRGA